MWSPSRRPRVAPVYDDEPPYQRQSGWGSLGRALAPMALILALALVLPFAIPLLVAVLGALIRHFQEVTDSLSKLFLVLIFLATWVVAPAFVGWIVVRLGRDAWYKVKVFLIHAKRDRYPVKVSPSGQTEHLDKQLPLRGVSTLHIHQENSTTPTLPAQGTLEGEPPEPRPISFAEIVGRIPPGQQLLEIRPTGELVLGTLAEDLMTTLYMGKSRMGKSISVTTELALEVRNGARLLVADPHREKADSLARKIAPLQRFLWPGTVIERDPEAIYQLLLVAIEEMARRRKGGACAPVVLVVVDEFGFLFDDPNLRPTLVKLANELVREGSGFNMYGKFVTHRLAGGMAAHLRRLAQSYVLHRCDYQDANEILHDSLLAKAATQLPRGHTFVVDATGNQERLQKPLTTTMDVAALVASLEPAAWDVAPPPPLAFRGPPPPPSGKTPEAILAEHEAMMAARQASSSSSSSSSSPAAPAEPEPLDLGAWAGKKKGKNPRLAYTEDEEREVLRLHFVEGIPASLIHQHMGKGTQFYYQVRAIIQAAKLRTRSEEEEAELVTGEPEE